MNERLRLAGILTCITLIIFLSILWLTPMVFVSAQENTDEALQTVIVQLQEQIKTLQEQVKELKSELAEAKIKIKFTETLYRGISGDKVVELQEFLKQFPDIYPEGLVTGYFGLLTETAVQKLQEKHGIVSGGTSATTGYGQVGPKTRAQLNSLLATGAGSSGVTPPGLLTAPGIQKKLTTSTSTVPPTTATSTESTTPTTTPAVPAIPATPSSGGGGGGGGGATPATPAEPESDTTPPVISNIETTSIAETSVTITWDTDESASGEVYYAVGTPIFSTTTIKATGTDSVTSHNVNLSNLTASTTYYYVAVSKDSSGNTATSSEYSFGTLDIVVEIPESVKWTFNIGSRIFSSPAIGSDGTIYIGADDNKLYAINPDGTEKWSFLTGNRILSEPAIGQDGTIYIGSFDGNLYAINSDGTEKWSLAVGDIYGSPAIASGGTIYVGTSDGALQAVSSEGSLQWSFSTEEQGSYSPSVGSDGTIYIGSYTGGHNLYAVNPDGTEKWSYDSGEAIETPLAINGDGTIYFGTSPRGGKFYAINSDGTLKWLYELPSDAYYNSILSGAAIAEDGTIYFSSWDSNDGYLYALNSDGTLKWEYLLDWHTYSSPAIGDDGVIYIGTSVKGSMYAVNPDGTTNFVIAIGDNIMSSPAIGDDGTVYFGSFDGNLYAVYSSSSGLANSAWPKFGHDNKNTGSSQ